MVILDGMVEELSNDEGFLTHSANLFYISQIFAEANSVNDYLEGRPLENRPQVVLKNHGNCISLGEVEAYIFLIHHQSQYKSPWVWIDMNHFHVK